MSNSDSNPALNAFYLGRALAEVIGERLEDAFTDAMSELGKFDAEQRERWRQFTEEVIERAERDTQSVSSNGSQSDRLTSDRQTDLQEDIDELRASIASARAALNAYKSRQS